MSLSFPPDFIWGSATSSFQIEGASATDGKGPSIWDAFCMIPGKVDNNDHGQIACDHYHKMKDDVAMMKAMGLKAYRFSIAWPRIFPSGTDEINEKGVQFYSDLIDTLIENDIEPWITLFHWDLPLALEIEKDGWLNASIIEAFTQYADLCFERFGGRVKNWITFNEPWVVTVLGYGLGVFAPGRISNTEPYIAGHNLLLAHAKTVALFREKYQPGQGGRIGITCNCDWREPASNDPKDITAAQRALEFMLSWFMDPVYKGRYPDSMIERLGPRLPAFSESEKELLKGSADFFGLNHYSTMLVSDAGGHIVEGSVYENGGLLADQDIKLSADPAWQRTEMGWPIVPWGFRKLLEWIDERYDRPEIIITENGGAFDDKMINGHVDDKPRLNYYKTYLAEAHKAIGNGVHLGGYFAWSLMDNFEWASGYAKRFGLHYVDFETLERTPKASAKWLRKVVAQNGFEE
ncbi:MAG: GH1 family beta-glucosidase [Bacteroidota bacterium]